MYAAILIATIDLPAPGDYEGDGTTDPAVFRQSSETWSSPPAHVDDNILDLTFQQNT